MTSPIGSLFRGMLNQLGAGSEFGAVVDTDQRRRLLRGLFESYYADQTGRDVVIDTNRMWCAHLPAIKDLFPDAKVIACVRNLAWVMDSIERRYQANPFEITRLFGDDIERNTIYSRIDTLAQRNRLVGYAWSALKEAYYGEHAASLLLVEYDLLAKAPQQVIPLIYQFLGEAPFDHDYERVAYDAPEFDATLGLHGLHRVREKVAFEQKRTILPPDLFAQYDQPPFWLDTTNSRAHVITVRASGASAIDTPR